MELISRDEVMRLAESGKLLSGSFGERAKDIIKAIPTREERNIVCCNKCLYNEDGYCTMWFAKIEPNEFCSRGKINK